MQKNNLTQIEFGLDYDWRKRWDTAIPYKQGTLADLSMSKKVRQMTAEPKGSHPTQQNKTPPELVVFYFGGNGGIRTHDTLPYT